MQKPGFTNSPCPGCGEKNERKKDSVCPECLALLHTAKKHKELYNQFKSKDGFIECQVPFGWDGPRYFTMRTNQHNKHLDKLGEVLIRLSQLCSIPLGYKVNWGYMRYLENRASFCIDDGSAMGYDLPVVYIKEKAYNKKKYDGTGKSIMPREIYDALNDLNEAIETAISGTEKEAVEFGKNVLFLLNSGEITMNQFNEK